MSAERSAPTLTALAPAGLAADMEAVGFRGPYIVDRSARGIILDRAGHVVVPIGPVPTAPALRGKLAALLAAALNALEAERVAIRNPLDPAHLDAVSAQSRRLAESLSRKRPDAAE